MLPGETLHLKTCLCLLLYAVAQQASYGKLQGAEHSSKSLTLVVSKMHEQLAVGIVTGLELCLQSVTLTLNMTVLWSMQRKNLYTVNCHCCATDIHCYDIQCCCC